MGILFVFGVVLKSHQEEAIQEEAIRFWVDPLFGDTPPNGPCGRDAFTIHRERPLVLVSLSQTIHRPLGGACAMVLDCHGFIRNLTKFFEIPMKGESVRPDWFSKPILRSAKNPSGMVSVSPHTMRGMLTAD